MNPRHAATATTRTATRGQSRPAAALLHDGQLVFSVESGLSYRIGRMLGAGGFGQVFLASARGPLERRACDVCIKVSTRMDGWLREAYFGQLLHDHPRAIRVFDTFPLMIAVAARCSIAWRSSTRVTVTSARSSRATRGVDRAAVRREIAGMLQVLGKLHRGQLLHRDLTPLNVFVCDEHRLKLGDFGIVRQQSDRRGVTARTLNPLMAPSDIFDGAAPEVAVARRRVSGGAAARRCWSRVMRRAASARAEVRSLACSDQLKEIVYRCIGERRKRYESADELISALDHAAGADAGGRGRSR